MNRPSAIRLVLVVIALVLGGAAQALIGSGNFRWAITPYVVAVAAMALAVADRPLQFPVAVGARRETASNSPAESVERHTDRFGELERLLGLAGFALAASILGASLYLFAEGPPNTLAWYLFGGSITLLLLTLPTLESRWSSLTRRLQTGPLVSIDFRTAIPWLVLGGILALALAVRLYHLQELPAGLWFDEADNIGQARLIQLDPGSAPVFSNSTNLPTLFLMPIAAVLEFSGVTLTSGRLVSVAFGVAGIVAVFLLVRLMLGNFPALMAALLTAVMRWDINWSRIGMHGITAPLFAALTAYLTLRAVRSGRTSDFGYAGAALGLGMWFYTSFRLFPLVVAFILVHYLVTQRPEARRFVGQVVAMAAVAFIVAAPVVQSAIVDSDEFFARTRTTSVFSILPFGDAITQIRESLGEHALMFNYKGDPNPRHNLPEEPMLDVVSGTLFLLGLGVAMARWRNVALLSLPFWVFLMAIPGVLSVPWESPQSLRSIAVIPAVVALITLALAVIWWVGRSAPWPVVRWTTPFALAAILATIAFINIDTYFGEQARNPEVFASFTTDELLMAEHMVEQQRRGYSLFVSRQFLYSLTRSIVAQHPRVEVIRAPVDVPLDPERVWLGASIYLEPREAGVYRLLRSYYPDGRFEEVRPPGGNEVLYYSAVISREQLKRRQGLSARYTLPDGTVRRATLETTEGVWLLDFEPDELPFDLLWEGALHVVEPGEYLLSLDGDVDAEVALDGRQVFSGDLRSIRVDAAVGLHSLEVRARVRDRTSTLRLRWQPPSGELAAIPTGRLYHGSVRPVGLSGSFYGSGVESPNVDARRVTPAMDTFYYDPVIPEPYLAVWEGRLEAPTDGDYGFEVTGAGALKLFLDGTLRASTPASASARPSAVVALAAGEHRMRVEYTSEFPPSEFKVLWQPPGGPREPIPIDRLSPAPAFMFTILGGE